MCLLGSAKTHCEQSSHVNNFITMKFSLWMKIKNVKYVHRTSSFSRNGFSQPSGCTRTVSPTVKFIQEFSQLEKSVCMGWMLCSKAAYWESPELASLSWCAAWESWKAASGWAESGSRVHSLSRSSATPFNSSQKPKAKAAFRRRFSS